MIGKQSLGVSQKTECDRFERECLDWCRWYGTILSNRMDLVTYKNRGEIDWFPSDMGTAKFANTCRTSERGHCGVRCVHNTSYTRTTHLHPLLTASSVSTLLLLSALFA